jgi:hypothetical protein
MRDAHVGEALAADQAILADESERTCKHLVAAGAVVRIVG